MWILTIKKKNDQMPLFFLTLRKMNEITYVKKTRDDILPNTTQVLKIETLRLHKVHTI
jgi:hypothetical protein